MSSFGAAPLDLANVDWVVSSANKCLQGVPGFSYALVRRAVLARCHGQARSLSLDLEDQVLEEGKLLLPPQDAGMERTGQFRFTPPTHALLAFQQVPGPGVAGVVCRISQALKEYHDEGGLQGRMAR